MFIKRAHAPHEFELNLTPIIDCFVTLICFLLLSATYVNLVGMDAKVPVSVFASQAQAKDEPKFKLELNVKPNGMELVASGAGAATGKRFFANLKPVAGQAGVNRDLVSLHAELLKVKHQRPKEFSIMFSSQVDMNYEDLVKIMDATRNLGAKDGELSIQDERNGKTVKVDLLFPDFVMANLGIAPQSK